MAGALYLICIWLVSGPALITVSAETNFGQRLLELSNVVGESVTLGALGFLAFLLGSLLVISGPKSLATDTGSTYTFIPHGVSLPDAWYDEYLASPQDRWRRHWRSWRGSTHRLRKAWSFARSVLGDLFRRNSYYRSSLVDLMTPLLVGRPAFHDTLITWAARALAPALNAGLTPQLVESAPRVPTEFSFFISDALGHRYAWPGGHEARDQMSESEAADADAIDGQWAIVDNVARYVRTEIQSLTLQLQIGRSELYNDYDRMRAEAEFRFTISPAIALLVLIAAFQWTPWALLFTLVSAALIVSGVRRQVKSEGLIWAVLASGELEAPIMSALLAIPLDQAEPARIQFRDSGP